MKTWVHTLILLTLHLNSQNYCMRFYGHGTGDIDRVKIPIDAPEKPADIGSTDFTIEFEMRALLSDNPKGGNAQAGANDDWTLGHVIIDRDIFGPGDFGDFGISLCNGKIAFGVNNGSNSRTIIGNTNVANNQWHHIAVTRQASNGTIRLYVDGNLDASFTNGPAGNISYRNGRSTSWPNDPYLVLGAEKHDYDNNNYPSYNGHIDELRISNIIRYSGNSFVVPAMPFNTDANTVALYHFDEGSGTVLLDASGFSGGPSNGQVKFGGTPPAGPVWVPRNPMGTEENLSKHYLHIYPNPYVNGKFFISGDYDKIEIVDLIGKKIYFQEKTITTQHHEIMLNNSSRYPVLLIIYTKNGLFKEILIPDNQ
ncbi:MAG: LamG domain-containing protein [Bacteroidia bacterium]|nr:LamG domain-containing protein [Bacteroidia bacterium]